MKCLNADQITAIIENLSYVPIAKRRQAFEPFVRALGGVDNLEVEFERVVRLMGEQGERPRSDIHHNTDLIHVHRLSCAQQARLCKGPDWIF